MRAGTGGAAGVAVVVREQMGFYAAAVAVVAVVHLTELAVYLEETAYLAMYKLYQKTDKQQQHQTQHKAADKEEECLVTVILDKVVMGVMVVRLVKTAQTHSA